MKRKFIFVRNPQRFHVNDVIYHVYVGDSNEDEMFAACVRECAADCGMYFHLYNDDVCQAIENLASSLFPGRRWARHYLRSCSISIKALYQLVQGDKFALFEKNLHETPQKLKLLVKIENELNRSLKNFKCKTRANLRYVSTQSLSLRLAETPVAVKFCLILLLFLCSAWLDGHSYLFY